MSRIGITYLEVAKLAQEIQIRGDHPTIEKIRVGLGGRGSNTTISKFLNEWRNQWNSALAKEITKQMPSLRLPESVNALMDNAWEQMDKEAQAEVEKIKQQTQKEIENIQLELIQVKDAQKKTLEHNTLLTHERRELLADKDKLTKENQELNQKIQNIEIEFLLKIQSLYAYIYIV